MVDPAGRNSSGFVGRFGWSRGGQSLLLFNVGIGQTTRGVSIIAGLSIPIRSRYTDLL